jgi:hypothetical protein
VRGVRSGSDRRRRARHGGRALFAFARSPEAGAGGPPLTHAPGSISRLLHLLEGAKVEGSLTMTQLLGVNQSRIRAPAGRKRKSVRTIRGSDWAQIGRAIGGTDPMKGLGRTWARGWTGTLRPSCWVVVGGWVSEGTEREGMWFCSTPTVVHLSRLILFYPG